MNFYVTRNGLHVHTSRQRQNDTLQLWLMEPVGGIIFQRTSSPCMKIKKGEMPPPPPPMGTAFSLIRQWELIFNDIKFSLSTKGLLILNLARMMWPINTIGCGKYYFLFKTVRYLGVPKCRCKLMDWFTSDVFHLKQVTKLHKFDRSRGGFFTYD